VTHGFDDGLLQQLIDQAEDEAVRFCDRTHLPTLPPDQPPMLDDECSELPEDAPSDGDPVAPSVRKAVMFLVQGAYEGANADEIMRLRRAAEQLLWPYRARLGA
jgi:hypothetical protein